MIKFSESMPPQDALVVTNFGPVTTGEVLHKMKILYGPIDGSWRHATAAEVAEYREENARIAALDTVRR